MKIDEIKNVAVVGAGNMGHQIALQCALCGFKTVSTDVIPAVLEKAEKFCDTYLPSRVAKGKLREDAAKKARSLISFTGDLKEAVKDADLVIEAVLERIDLKRKIFADLDKFAPSKAILATNSFFHCQFPHRGCHQSSLTSLQPAFLQPRAGHEARRSGPRAPCLG